MIEFNITVHRSQDLGRNKRFSLLNFLAFLMNLKSSGFMKLAFKLN